MTVAVLLQEKMKLNFYYDSWLQTIFWQYFEGDKNIALESWVTDIKTNHSILLQYSFR